MASLATMFQDDAQAAVLRSFEEFVARELRPLARETCGGWGDPVPDEIQRHVRRRSARLGFYAGEYPEDCGGQGMPFSVAVLLREAAGRSGCPLAPLAVAGAEGPSPILLAGTPQQREEYLRPLVLGEQTRCLAMTEPEAGSDAFAISTRAARDGDGWVLSGRKIFVSNADQADFVLVVARTGDGPGEVSVFVVRQETPGLSLGQRFAGMSGEPLFELVLDGVRVPSATLIGAAGHFTGIAALSRGRLLVAGACNGIAEFALSLALEHARQRTAFGRRIGAFQHVQEHLVASRLAVESSKLLTLAAARRADAGADVVEDASLAKLAAAQTVTAVVDRAVQVLGASALVRGHPLEWLYRHVRMMPIIEGTTEIQKVIVAGGLGLG